MVIFFIQYTQHLLVCAQTLYTFVSNRPKLEERTVQYVLNSDSSILFRYTFKVEARLVKNVYSAAASVEVVGGDPPLLTLRNPSFSRTEGFSLPATASDLKPGCQLFWHSIPLVGYRTVSLVNVVRTLKCPI